MYQRKLDTYEFEFGTSGLLYQSSKLMYDHQTNSLWSTLQGKPVVGSLVGKNISLQKLPGVTSTWEKWVTRHPSTTVLSLDTGHERDYGEGVAYRDYFATQKLKYSVTRRDDRLENKTNVLILRDGSESVAITIDLLVKQNCFHQDLGDRKWVLLTDSVGTCRVYDASHYRFSSWNGNDRVIDELGNAWHVTEDALVSQEGMELKRFAAHRAYWFGWYAQFPNAKLVK